MLWLKFIACTVVIVYSGMRLSRYGDVIAEKTGLGRAWIGLVLMASVTSLPELITGLSSVTYADVPDIAVGDALGSCVFNILIIALLDAQYRIMPISAKAHHGNILSAAFGILLLGLVAISIFAREYIPPLAWIGPHTVLIIIIYLIAMRTIYFYEKKQLALVMKEKAIELQYQDIPTRTAVLNYFIHAIIVIGSSVLLPKIGAAIGLTYRAEKKRLFIAWDSMAIIGVYIVNGLLLYHLK